MKAIELGRRASDPLLTRVGASALLFPGER